MEYLILILGLSFFGGWFYLLFDWGRDIDRRYKELEERRRKREEK